MLGTAFNVIEKAYRTEVILEEGRVKLNLNRDFEPELYLEPGEMATFSIKTSEKVEKRAVKSQVLTSWKDGVLEFDDVPLSKVMDLDLNIMLQSYDDKRIEMFLNTTGFSRALFEQMIKDAA